MREAKIPKIPGRPSVDLAKGFALGSHQGV